MLFRPVCLCSDEGPINRSESEGHAKEQDSSVVQVCANVQLALTSLWSGSLNKHAGVGFKEPRQELFRNTCMALCARTMSLGRACCRLFNANHAAAGCYGGIVGLAGQLQQKKPAARSTPAVQRPPPTRGTTTSPT